MTWENMADEALMVNFRDGKAAAFDVLYARHKAPLFRYFRRQCASQESAEEMFQDVWMNIVRSRARYRAGLRSRISCVSKYAPAVAPNHESRAR